ncbi:hypothetical protein DFH09DRAFT_1327674 [Mycena vulgaris]|nr:hypothetical protein DFH09DRAFT_1327674 [Mycena vulgaris]
MLRKCTVLWASIPQELAFPPALREQDLISIEHWNPSSSVAQLHLLGFSNNRGVLGLSAILPEILSLDINDRRDGGVKAIALILSIMHGNLPLAVLMLRAVSPVEVFREGTMGLPRLRWGRRTHQDRASALLDARTDWRWKCGVSEIHIRADKK